MHCVNVSHGGVCAKMENNEDDQLLIEEPYHLQSRHEEADTLIAFHANSITTGNILVRSTDTEFFVILLGLCRKGSPSSWITGLATTEGTSVSLN
jgi:hypothetical protein